MFVLVTVIIPSAIQIMILAVSSSSSSVITTTLLCFFLFAFVFCCVFLLLFLVFFFVANGRFSARSAVVVASYATVSLFNPLLSLQILT